MRERNYDHCFHFNGIQHDRCDAGVTYDDVKTPGDGLVCLKTDADACRLVCGKYRHWTDEEIAARKAASARTMDLLRRGLSACCEEPIDERRVIRSGRHQGHGPRFCSKCGKLAFIV